MGVFVIGGSAAGPYRYVKHRIHALDKWALVCKYAMIEGDASMGKLKYAKYGVHLEGYGRGGCICKLTSKYKVIDVEGVEIKEEDIEYGQDRAIGMYEVLGAHLMAPAYT